MSTPWSNRPASDADLAWLGQVCDLARERCQRLIGAAAGPLDSRAIVSPYVG